MSSYFVWYQGLYCQPFAPWGFPNWWALQPHKAQEMMHGDVGTGVDGRRNLIMVPIPIMAASTLMTPWNMVQVPFTMNLYLCCLLHLTTSFLLSNEDIRPFLLSKWRQRMATLMAITTFSANHLEVEPFDYGDRLIHCTGWYLTCLITWSPHMVLFVLLFIFCFETVSRWCRVTRFTQPHVLTYMFCPYVISTPLPVTWRIQMRTFKRYLSCAFFSQLYT
jgi:hypothetical protein